MKKLLSILLLIPLAASAFGQQTYTFAHRDTTALQLDVYQPANPRPDHACVLYVFGGGFFSGARNNQSSTLACQALADRGFVAVSIDYRLFLRHAHQLPLLQMYTNFDTAIRYAVEDVSSAVNFLCSHAQELGINSSRIILTGSSAGAIAVLQADYCRANRLPAAIDMPGGFRPAAVVPYAGAILCRNRALHYATPPAPTCFFHGTADKVVNYRRFRGAVHTSLFGASSVAKVFKSNNYSYAIMRFKGNGHEVAIALPNTINEFCAFVDATLAGHKLQYDATCKSSGVPTTAWSKLTVFDLYLGKKRHNALQPTM